MNATIVSRHHLEVRGIVQGVGFRPFVYRLARELALDGWVRNDAAGVTLEIEGPLPALAAFASRLREEAPPLARIDAVAVTAARPLEGQRGFAILASERGRAATLVGPDTAICTECLAELFDPADRRYRHPFINCTNCGPRYTITRALPYDRRQTSMRDFAQCPQCLAEYRDPAHRRFHAEPNACPLCGPVLAWHDACGRRSASEDPVREAMAAIAAGGIVAIKGMGGFHLVCDARRADAVARLRERKEREEKPFAVMVANVGSARQWGAVDEDEARWLASRERPIVLLRKRPDTDELLSGVAPGLAWLGLMLPYTPLQYLLFHELAGRPAGTGWLDAIHATVLVMTSANPAGEPLVTDNDEALRRLAGIADGYLMHDRAILIRCDDSVLRGAPDAAGRIPQLVRRARGYTPRAIPIDGDGPDVLAVGGTFKNTICITRGDEAFVSEHVGDLDNAPTCIALERTIDHLVDLLAVAPSAVAHDLHPDFHSTRHAAALARRWDVPLVAVQHHHAHVAAVLAEHRVAEPTLGLALDGVGLGTDGAAWGGELLWVEGASMQRCGHLAPLALPGGDRAAREPWRMAAAALARAGRTEEIRRRFGDEPACATVVAMLGRGVHAPQTSSAGRWFDAAAGLLGVRRRMAFEGQAAMLLEGLAEAHGPVAAGSSLFAIDARNRLDLTPLVAALADCRDAGYGAALFHATLAAGLADWVAGEAARRGVSRVAAGGGCFLNALVTERLRATLAARGIALLTARAVPPNDGGLALGQAWVARKTMHTIAAGASAAAPGEAPCA